MVEIVGLYAINKYDINLKNRFNLAAHNNFILGFPCETMQKVSFWLEILKANN